MKTVLVTGASKGLGKAIADIFHQKGFEVIATDIDTKPLSNLFIRERFTILELDVTSEKSVKSVAETVANTFGQIDVLVSNAGIFDFYPLSDAGSEKLKKIFDVNVFGMANLIKYFLTLLQESKGRLIVVSSESYKVPAPFQPYSLSKQALEKLFNGTRLELMTKGIKSILIRPGPIQTDLLDRTINFKLPENNSVFKNELGKFLFTMKKYIGKISSPEEVAAVIFKAGTMKNPKPIYYIRNNPLVTLISILPEILKDLFVRRSIQG